MRLMFSLFNYIWIPYTQINTLRNNETMPLSKEHIEKQILIESRRLYEIGTTDSDKPRFMVKDNVGWQTITWGQVLEYTTSITQYFINLGIGHTTKVAIFAKNHVEWAYFDAAIRAVRAVFVPVYASNTPKQVLYVLNHSDSEIVVTDLENLPTLFTILKELPLLKKVIVIDLESEDDLLKVIDQFGEQTGILLRLADLNIVSFRSIYEQYDSLRSVDSLSFYNVKDVIHPEDVATILYTSGTTGNPKGVVLSHYNIHTNAQDWIEVLGDIMPQTRVDLLWLPMSHIFGWGELGLGNTLGFCSYLTTHTEVLHDMVHVKPTIFMSVPAYWEKLYGEAKAWAEQKTEQISKLHEITGGRLRFCLSGGAGLKREIKEFFYEAGLLIIEGYGLTECAPTLTMNRKDDFDFDTVGKPFPRVKLKLETDGEILAKGPNIFKEYYKNPQETSAVFDDEGWFKTGDLGKVTQNGFLKIIGRKKEIIVTTGGKNISPQVIEAQFKNDPYIEHIVLYGNEKKYLTAFVTLQPESIRKYAIESGLSCQDFSVLVQHSEIHALVQERIDKVNQRLASYETIKRFFINNQSLTVEADFLTPSLKIKRHNIHDVFATQLDSLYE